MNHVNHFHFPGIFERKVLIKFRYALQFQVGILGIILTFALAWQMKEGRQRMQVGMALFCL